MRGLACPALKHPSDSLRVAIFRRSCCRIKRRADERDLRRDGIFDPGYRSVVAARAQHELLRLHLRDVQLGDQRRSIHYRQHRSAGSRSFARKQRPVRDYARDRAADLGVAQLRLGAKILPFGRFEITLRIF